LTSLRRRRLGITSLVAFESSEFFVDNSKETSYAVELRRHDHREAAPPPNGSGGGGYLALVLPPSIDVDSARAELETRGLIPSSPVDQVLCGSKVAFSYFLVQHDALVFAIVENGDLLPPQDFSLCGVADCPSDCGLSSLAFYD